MKELFESEKFKDIFTKKNVVVVGGIIVILIVVLLVFNMQGKITKEAEFSSVNRICELAAVKCYYHNVGEYESKATGVFNFGYKKYWFEYNGIVELGINASEVQISDPDKNGVVKIYVPEVEILSTYQDEKSMTKPITDAGIFTSITSEEKVKALSEAQATMRANADADVELKNKAKSNVKKLLEQYVINLGKQMGKDYSVEWI